MDSLDRVSFPAQFGPKMYSADKKDQKNGCGRIIQSNSFKKDVLLPNLKALMTLGRETRKNSSSSRLYAESLYVDTNKQRTRPTKRLQFVSVSKIALIWDKLLVFLGIRKESKYGDFSDTKNGQSTHDRIGKAVLEAVSPEGKHFGFGIEDPNQIKQSFSKDVLKPLIASKDIKNNRELQEIEDGLTKITRITKDETTREGLQALVKEIDEIFFSNGELKSL